MSAESAQAHCIADDSVWLDSIQAVASSPILRVSWAEFNSAPMDFASSKAIAVALVSEFSDEIDQQLGRLCRSFPSGVVVELANGLPVQNEQLFAHGFQKLKRVGKEPSVGAGEQELSTHLLVKSSATGERCFEYRLRDYKAVPHWLNARFWAHPERFNL